MNIYFPLLQMTLRFAVAIALLFVACAVPAYAADDKGKKNDSEDSAEEQDPPRHAYDLGSYRIKNFRPVEREKVTLEFAVYAEVEDAHHERGRGERSRRTDGKRPLEAQRNWRRTGSRCSC